MKKAINRMAWLLAIVLLALPAAAQKDPKILKFPDVEFKPLKPEHAAIQKGIDFYYKINNETPTITVMVIFKNGSLANPKGKEGLAALAYRLMKSGGTTTRKADLLEEQLDFLGSSVNAFAAGEYAVVTMNSLAKNLDKTWEIFIDILNNPVYDQTRVDLEKKKELETIRRRWDQPMMAGMILYNDLIFGRDFPDTRRTKKKGIESITAADLKSFYQERIKNREIIIAAVGDFAPTALKAKIKKSFSKWQGNPEPKLDLPKAKLAAKPGIYLIDKPDMTQAVVCLGHLGINRHDPDNVEVEIMNFIFGTGSFNSRMMREIRSNRGLAYAAFGAVEGGRDLGPLFTFCMTKNESAAEVIKLTQEIMTDMIQNPVKPEELETAKKYSQNSFVHRFDSAQTVLTQTLFNKLQGYPDNYYETYIPRIKKVDAAKVMQMAKRMLHPDQVIILVVGKKAELFDQLKKLGDVTEMALPED